MQETRRHMLLAAGGGLASMSIAGATERFVSSPSPALEAEVVELVQRSHEANAALMRGDVDRYRAQCPLTADFVLMSPFGGRPSHARDINEQVWEEMKMFFRNGSFEQTLVQSYATRDMVTLVTIERTHCEVGGLPAQDWALRVTLVYCREGSEWKLAHRHADPLAGGISLAGAAAMARANVEIQG